MPNSTLALKIHGHNCGEPSEQAGLDRLEEVVNWKKNFSLGCCRVVEILSATIAIRKISDAKPRDGRLASGVSANKHWRFEN
jgi:hypothetical protein